MKKRFDLKVHVLMLSVLSICILSMAFLSSCEKDSNDLKEETQEEIAQKDLPPYREFECGEQTVPPSPYPCPNASCDYMGWDCLWEHVVWDPPHDGGEKSYTDYSEAAEVLRWYITEGNTDSFFKTRKDELSILMPSLVEPSDPVLQAMLADLQEGITSVIMHPVFDSETELTRYIFQIYVVVSGNPPDYSNL